MCEIIETRSVMEGFGIILILIVYLYGFIAYIKSLVNAARTNKWIWFVLMLLMWPLFFLYLIFEYDSSKKPEYSDEK